MKHTCHWPGCPKEVSPKLWGCPGHWFRLPPNLRLAVWSTYRPGQEITKTPSREYVAVARAVQDWIAQATVVKCGECRSPMELRNSKHGQFYGCTKWPRCDGTHGAHPNGSPMGVPADKATKLARIEAHKAFDELWKSGTYSRSAAYSWMRKAMGLDRVAAHISRFDVEQCQQLQQLLLKRPTQIGLLPEKNDASAD